MGRRALKASGEGDARRTRTRLVQIYTQYDIIFYSSFNINIRILVEFVFVNNQQQTINQDCHLESNLHRHFHPGMQQQQKRIQIQRSSLSLTMDHRIIAII
ncbi:hypothetical protein DERF_012478 [Dermatophagoides farinae]|uniref:Uncharacterized protein n=1 Tax=Dermatophagoides farinae TaxID=6954 RepID=A0A922HPN1_DERFA|nr:hypothetical protein DERF_012478 [Dermatophagoides farinae]